MPIYEYRCEKCSKEFERVQKITDESLTSCPDCQGKIHRIVSQTSFTLKGSGWYKDGYASPSKGEKKAETPKPTTPAEKKPPSSD